jgi:hypothetical protein
MVNGTFDRNLLAICPIGGWRSAWNGKKAIFSGPAGTIVFMTT